jgi:hypothetical protein
MIGFNSAIDCMKHACNFSSVNAKPRTKTCQNMHLTAEFQTKIVRNPRKNAVHLGRGAAKSRCGKDAHLRAPKFIAL